MRIERLFIGLLFFCIFICNTSYAQQCKGAIGARFGYGIGLTGQYYFDQRNGHALEFLLRYGYHGILLNRPGINIQALYEKHWEFRRNRNWTGYVGAGPAIGIGRKSVGSKQNYFAFGASPILGIDYTTQRLAIPFILSLDYKPTFYANAPLGKGKQKVEFERAEEYFTYFEIAFSVRFGIR